MTMEFWNGSPCPVELWNGSPGPVELWNGSPCPVELWNNSSCPWNSGMTLHTPWSSGMSPSPRSSFPVATAAAGSGFPSWMPQDGVSWCVKVQTSKGSSQSIIGAFPAPGSAFGGPCFSSSVPGMSLHGSHLPPVWNIILPGLAWPFQGESAAPDWI